MTTPPLIAVVGWSGSGKTTLVERVLAQLTAGGRLRVGAMKHSKHAHTLDRPGKDSFRHKAAGAQRSLFVGPAGLQLVADLEGAPSPQELAARFLADLDLVVLEGFMQTPVDKVEVVRAERSTDVATTPAEGLVAIATDMPPESFADVGVPVFPLDDAAAIAAFITHRYELTP